jgi:hypothetical protein
MLAKKGVMMQTPRGYQSRLVLVGLALGVILALLIWPATRWLVRSQLALLIPTPASVAPWSVGAQAGATTARQRDHETARRHRCGDCLIRTGARNVGHPAPPPA